MITERDTGYSAFRQRMEKLGRAQLTVGVHEDKGAEKHGKNITTAGVAAAHEFGLGVPERSFLRSTVDENDGFRRESQITMQKVAQGEAPEQALELLGEHIVGKVKQKIRSGIKKPLKDKTLQAKRRRLGGQGGETPLILTGQLIGSITHQVEFK